MNASLHSKRALRVIAVLARLGICLAVTAMLGCATNLPVLGDHTPPQGIVRGSFWEHGQSHALTHAYARSKTGENPRGAITVVLASRPLLSVDLDSIVEGTFRSPDHVEGVVIDIVGDSEWGTRLLGSDGVTSFHGFSASGGRVWRDNEEVGGLVEFSNQDEAGTSGFRLSFTAPIPESALELPSGNDMDLRGRWLIGTWRGDEADSECAGYIDIGASVGGRRYSGEAKLRAAASGREVREPLLIVIDSAEIRMYGAVDPSETWMSDSLKLHLQNGELIGDGVDEAGRLTHIVLRRR